MSKVLVTVIRRSALSLILVLMSTSLRAEIPRTFNGDPNLQGTWYYGSATPLERPEELGLQRSLTDTQVRARDQSLHDQYEQKAVPLDPDRGTPEAGAEIGQEADAVYNAVRTNLTLIDGEYRTSLIVDPPNGRLPYRAGGKDIFDRWREAGFGEFDGPEMRPASERCLNVAGPMPPMVGWGYNANMRIVQTPEFIVIVGEMQGARIIPIGGEFSLGGPQWMGESIGRWQGGTLVVHTRKFRPEQSWFWIKSSDQLEVMEYFDLVSQDNIRYRYVVTDPEIYNSPWTVEMDITRRAPGERLYEFACHEGNYSFSAILRGARVQEAESVKTIR
jgi:hypothetical protein